MALLQHLTDLQAGNVSTTATAAAGDGTAPPGGTASASVMQARMSLSSAAAAALGGGGGGSSGSDVAAKRAELQKLEELEGKISAELQSLKDQLVGLRGEMDTYSDVEGAKKAKEAARDGLEQQHQELQLQHESLKVYFCPIAVCKYFINIVAVFALWQCEIHAAFCSHCWSLLLITYCVSIPPACADGPVSPEVAAANEGGTAEGAASRASHRQAGSAVEAGAVAVRQSKGVHQEP